MQLAAVAAGPRRGQRLDVRFGVDQDVAVSAVLVYRIVSTYLPLTWGNASFRWLTKHEYL